MIQNYLIFCARSNVESRLPHDGHVEVMNEGDLQTFGALVVVAVVERLDVEEHCVSVVLPRFSALPLGVYIICLKPVE